MSKTTVAMSHPSDGSGSEAGTPIPAQSAMGVLDLAVERLDEFADEVGEECWAELRRDLLDSESEIPIFPHPRTQIGEVY